MIHGIDTRVATVAARLHLRGHVEVRGIRHRLNGPPLGTIFICGVEMDLTLPEARLLLEAMGSLVGDLETAEKRNGIAREPRTDTGTDTDRVSPR